MDLKLMMTGRESNMNLGVDTLKISESLEKLYNITES